MKTKFSRICPKCNKIVYYSNKKNCNKAIKNKIMCRACKDSSQLKGEFKKCLYCNKIFYSSISQSKRGWSKFCSPKCNCLYNCPGKYKRTNEILSKQSLSGRKRRYIEIKNKCGQIHPNFNSNACKLIDEYGKQNGYTFQHALNGGEHYIKELGYWVDGYDKNKNVVIEYYEDKHKKSIINDLNRKTEIINYLQCKFIELKEWEVNENINNITK